MSTLSLICNAIFLIAAVVTAYFCWRTNRNLEQIERIRKEREALTQTNRIEAALAMASEQTGTIECTRLEDSAPRYVKKGGADAQ